MAGIDGPGSANEAIRLGAARELLDRGFGKATTILAGDSEAPPSVIRFEWASAATQPEPVVAAVIEAAADDTRSSAPLTLAWQSNDF